MPTLCASPARVHPTPSGLPGGVAKPALCPGNAGGGPTMPQCTAPSCGAAPCCAGDMFQVLTNGVYTPTLHRVVNTDPSRSRVSIAYFHEPGFESLVEPLPQFVAPGAAPSFAPVRYGTHLESKVLNNFELEGKEACAQ